MQNAIVVKENTNARKYCKSNKDARKYCKGNKDNSNENCDEGVRPVLTGRRKRTKTVRDKRARFFVQTDFTGLKSLLSGKLTFGIGFERSASNTSTKDELELSGSVEDVEQLLNNEPPAELLRITGREENNIHNCDENDENEINSTIDRNVDNNASNTNYTTTIDDNDEDDTTDHYATNNNSVVQSNNSNNNNENNYHDYGKKNLDNFHEDKCTHSKNETKIITSTSNGANGSTIVIEEIE